MVGPEDSELLRAAREAGFEAFLTADQGIAYQQNLQALGMATVVLAAKSSTLAELEPLMPRVGEVLTAIRPGEVIKVAA